MSSELDNMNSTTLPTSHDVDSLSQSLKFFGAADYAVFITMLLLSSFVGLYFGYQDHKRKTSNRLHRTGSDMDNYLMGGKNMQVFPVALSLIASYASGITLLGTSTEIYLFGMQYAWFLLAIIVASFVIHHVVIPVVHELEITSIFQYLEARFNKEMCLFGSIVYCTMTMMWLPIVIYVPALAFSQTTGINVHIITPVSMFICILYTSLGGIKAVVWTDVLQITLMYGTLILIAVKGTAAVGGLEVLIERNMNGERFEAPDFRIDPTLRHTFFTLVIGGTFWWVNVNGANQAVIQRYLALKDVKTAQRGHIIFTIGVIILISLCIYNGLVLYATFQDCDPLKTKLVKEKDQLLPLLAVNTLRDFPGLSGLFVAGVFSAALSSASTALNSLSAVFLMDFFGSKKLSKRETSLIMRGTVIILGIIAVALVYVVQHMGAVLQLAMMIPGVFGGPTLGAFVIGLTLPWIGGKSTFCAAILSSVVMISIIAKAQIDSINKRIKHVFKPLSTDGCSYNFTTTVNTNVYSGEEKHHVSYLYYTLIGMIITIFLGIMMNYLLGFQDPSTVDERLIAPFMRKYIKRDVKVEGENGKFIEAKEEK